MFTLNPEDFKQAIQAIEALGSTPAVLVKVAELASDPNKDLDDISLVLRNDGPLAADIIRISNSPYYGPPTLHSNLNSAINYIGLREVTRVVTLSLARQLFARDLTSYGILAMDYWSDSVATALLMEALAKPAGLNPEDAYTLGILHAIGRVLINRVIDDTGFTIYWDGREAIEEWERKAVGFDFAEAGALLLEHWQFPAPMCEVIRGQLLVEPSADPATQLGALQFSRRLLGFTGLNLENTDWQLPAADPFVQAAHLTPELVTQIVADCREDFQNIRQTVDLK
jgi:HD-like signal output (HDOD) protein